jgi:hypothetical protein
MKCRLAGDHPDNQFKILELRSAIFYGCAEFESHPVAGQGLPLMLRPIRVVPRRALEAVSSLIRTGIPHHARHIA